VRIPVRVLNDDLDLPRYARSGDAGLDLLAASDVTLKPGERATVPTGVALAIPEGYAGFVHARSGRAAAEGLALVNAPGVIDSGYRGEVKAIVVNLDPSAPIYIRRGEKIAQLVVSRVERIELDPTERLPDTERGEGGFGSSGR
jgi:dUTP pyrophosphatase